MARSERAAHSDNNQSPPIDSTLANRLVAAFGPQCLRDEMNLLLAIEPLYRRVGGTLMHGKVARMSATEYHLVLHLWPSWWSAGAQPWPTVAEMATRLQKSERQVQSLLAALKKKGFVISEGRRAQEGQQRANRYDLTPFLLRVVDMLEKNGQDTTSQAQGGEGRHE